MPFDDYYRGPRHVSRHSTYTLIAARPRSLARGCYLPIHTERRTPVLVHLPLRSRGVRDSGTQQRRLSYRRANKSKRKSAVGSLFDATMPWDEKPVFFLLFFFCFAQNSIRLLSFLRQLRGFSIAFDPSVTRCVEPRQSNNVDRDDILYKSAFRVAKL